jgi:hypothetical protein
VVQLLPAQVPGIDLGERTCLHCRESRPERLGQLHGRDQVVVGLVRPPGRVQLPKHRDRVGQHRGGAAAAGAKSRDRHTHIKVVTTDIPPGIPQRHLA